MRTVKSIMTVYPPYGLTFMDTNHPVLNQALKEQVDKIAHSTLFGLVSPTICTVV